jgi:hypothetical protein
MPEYKTVQKKEASDTNAGKCPNISIAPKGGYYAHVMDYTSHIHNASEV